MKARIEFEDDDSANLTAAEFAGSFSSIEETSLVTMTLIELGPWTIGAVVGEIMSELALRSLEDAETAVGQLPQSHLIAYRDLIQDAIDNLISQGEAPL